MVMLRLVIWPAAPTLAGNSWLEMASMKAAVSSTPVRRPNDTRTVSTLLTGFLSVLYLFKLLTLNDST
jgi:hypothetical protein